MERWLRRSRPNQVWERLSAAYFPEPAPQGRVGRPWPRRAKRRARLAVGVMGVAVIVGIAAVALRTGDHVAVVRAIGLSLLLTAYPMIFLWEESAGRGMVARGRTVLRLRRRRRMAAAAAAAREAQSGEHPGSAGAELRAWERTIKGGVGLGPALRSLQTSGGMLVATPVIFVVAQGLAFLTSADIDIGLVSWAMMLGFFSPMAASVVTFSLMAGRVARRVGRGCCPSCGYDLRGLEGGSESAGLVAQCPECGLRWPLVPVPMPVPAADANVEERVGAGSSSC